MRHLGGNQPGLTNHTHDVFQNSNARSYETELRFPRFILSKTFQSGAAVRTAYKDLKLITDLEARLDIELPLAMQVRKYWEAAMSQIGGEADFTRVYELVKNKKELKALAAEHCQGYTARKELDRINRLTGWVLRLNSLDETVRPFNGMAFQMTKIEQINWIQCLSNPLL